MCCTCVTRRLALQQVVLSVAHQWMVRNGSSFGAPEFVDSIDRASLERSILILDLPSIGVQPGIVDTARRWRARHRGGTLVVVGDMVHRDLLEPLVKLDGAIVWSDLALDPAHWRLRFDEQTELLLVHDLRGQLYERIHDFRGAHDVGLILKLVELAPRAAATRVPELPVMRETVQAIRPGASLAALLREANHPPARHLLTVFQALWFAKLRTAGWSSDEIAQFLRFGVPRTQMRFFNRTLGLGVKELRELGFQAVLDWAADTINTRWPEDVLFSAIVAPLQARLVALRASRMSHDTAEIRVVSTSLLSMLGVAAMVGTVASMQAVEWLQFASA